ncbi:MAG: asparagine--tRNA ligase [Catalinimonas sp.]
MKRTKIKALLQDAPVGETIHVKGWVRTKRESKNVAFVAVNDGSVIHNLQVVINPDRTPDETLRLITTGACVAATGPLVASQGRGQSVELQAETVEVLGAADPEAYPLQPKRHSLEFLREIAHLRPRTSTFGAVLRVRHALAYAVHRFFDERGFIHLHTPIVTGSDAEGAGELFRVTTLDPTAPPRTDEGAVDWSADFFGRETNLTVSGQLEAELAALALAEVYTFGPTFRAENSNTARHLAEFWMIEPEMAFYDLHDNMDLAEAFLQYLVRDALARCADDLAFLDQRARDEEKGKKKEEQSEVSLLERLRFVVEQPFERLTYTEAIDVLLRSKPHKKGRFQFPVEWGVDLQSEHERYLVEKHFKRPVILTDYPREIKAFYMKQNDDGRTVRAMDVLFPGIGEMVGGSQREENLDKLRTRLAEMQIPEASLWWYVDTRRFGTAPHSGFGLGFERLVQFVTGMGNIRDVIPFPRTPKNAEF